MEMRYEEIVRELGNRQYRPVYFLAGDEPYYIDRITQIITEEVLPEAERSFNQMIVYGQDTDAVSVVDLAKRYPMMSSHLVVIVREAQDLPSLDAFESYFKSPLKSTILVLNYKYKTLSSRLKVYKALENTGVYFESKRIYEDKIPLWIEKYLKNKGYTMEPGVGMLLTEFLGNDLSRITGEMEKLMIVLPASEKVITGNHIEEYIGISKDYNNFELTAALAKKDILKSNRIVQHFANNPKKNPFTLTLTALFFFFSKTLLYQTLGDKSRGNAASALGVRPIALKDMEVASRHYSKKKLVEIISLLREYDMKSKGFYPVSTPPGELLQELTFKILH